jgi:hypothetical protein
VRIKVCLTSACYVEPVAGAAWFPYLTNAFALLCQPGPRGQLRPARGTPSVLALVLPVLGCSVAYLATLQVAVGNDTSAASA